jgi:hypothetical protein
MLSADRSLRSQQPSPLAPVKAKPKFGYMPPMIGDSTVADAQNNTRASSAGVGRMAMTDMDRAGISRGRGNQYASQIAEASADADARAGAAKQQMGADVANAAARQTYDFAMQGEQIGNSGLLENLRNQNAMAGWTRRGFGQNLREANRRGQFGLDQLQLDYTPFLQSLLR